MEQIEQENPSRSKTKSFDASILVFPLLISILPALGAIGIGYSMIATYMLSITLIFITSTLLYIVGGWMNGKASFNALLRGMSMSIIPFYTGVFFISIIGILSHFIPGIDDGFKILAISIFILTLFYTLKDFYCMVKASQGFNTKEWTVYLIRLFLVILIGGPIVYYVILVFLAAGAMT